MTAERVPEEYKRVDVDSLPAGSVLSGKRGRYGK